MLFSSNPKIYTTYFWEFLLFLFRHNELASLLHFFSQLCLSIQQGSFLKVHFLKNNLIYFFFHLKDTHIKTEAGLLSIASLTRAMSATDRAGIG